MKKEDLFVLLGKIAALILTVYGLIMLPLEIIEKTNSTLFGEIIACAIFVTFFMAITYYYTAPHTLRRFGLKRHKTKPILTIDLETVQIDENYRATISSDKSILFTEPPTEDDLVDIIDVSAIDSIDETVYESEDSTVVRYIRKNPNTLAIYWKPKREIVPFIPYFHKTQYVSPSNYGDEAFWQMHHIDLDTGIIEYTFNCPNKIEYALAFILPRFNAKVSSYKRLYRLAFIKRIRNCSQPKIDKSGYQVKWKLETPIKNRSYLCFVFYQNGVEKFKEQILSGALK